MGELWLRAETSVAGIELGQGGCGNFVNEGQGQFAAAPGEAFIVFDGGHDAGRRLEGFFAAVAPDLGHGEQHPAKTGAAITIVAGKIGSSEVRTAVRGEECGERPAALPADGRDGGLVARVHIGALVAIHLDGDEMLVDELGNLRIFVGFPVHDVAPVAPDGPDVEQDGLVSDCARAKAASPHGCH
jgi:hypothetical protein